MLYLETTHDISIESITTLLQHRVKGPVQIQRLHSLYTIQCPSTPEYNQLVTFIQEQGGFPLLVDGNVFILQTKL